MAADYDIITVGGGLAGSALAYAMAQAGKRVLVIEAEKEFRDRVRGEQMTTWGAAEAKQLGLYDLLVSSCAHQTPRWHTYLGPMQIDDRDLPATTPQGLPNLCFYHPAMQESLLKASAAAGAEVVRGVHVRNVTPGQPASVTFARNGGGEEHATARLIVGCDGRNSSVRGWAGFTSTRQPDRCQLSGLFMEDVSAPEEVNAVGLDPGAGIGAIVFPQGGGRVRTYVASRVKDGRRFSGERDIGDYVDVLRQRMPNGAEIFKRARPAGPLATFNGAED